VTFGVKLKKHPLRWRKFPISIRQKIVVGVDRVVAVRAEIETAAKTVMMPPITVVDVGWLDSSACALVFGAATMTRIGKRLVPGVVLPASTVVCVEDDAMLRTVLVHEFSHAFFIAVETIRAHDGGVANLGLRNPHDLVSEDESHIVPDQWFGEFDASHFSNIHNDDAMDGAAEAVMQKWIAAKLPTEFPSLRGQTACGITAVPTEWLNYVRAHILGGAVGNR
jgi:hypothetical protein